MAKRRSKGFLPSPPAVPIWVLTLLAAALVGLLWVRLQVEPPEPPAAPRLPDAPILEPPTFPETPPDEAAPLLPEARPAPLVRESRPAAGGPGLICLVLDDVGYHAAIAQRATEVLPRQVTFAVLPHLPASVESAEILHRAGFPVILHAPMEPLPGARVPVGQGALLVGMPPAEVGFILDQNLASVPYAEGLNNHMGSRATADRDLMREVMAFLRSKGLYFLDSRTTTATVAYRTAVEEGVPAAEKTLFLDDVDEPASIARYLDSLVERARRGGVAVGIGHLRPNTLEVLARRLPRLEGEGIRMVPLREVVR